MPVYFFFRRKLFHILWIGMLVVAAINTFMLQSGRVRRDDHRVISFGSLKSGGTPRPSHHPMERGRGEKLVVQKTPSTSKVKDMTISSSSRWEDWFHHTFDVPDPIEARAGPHIPTFQDKYVIYRCETKGTMANCGGWADRVRGMFTAYILARLSGRVFKAEFIMPKCDVKTFMVPNRVNWSLPVSLHKVVEDSEKVKVLDMWAERSFYYSFKTTDWINHPVMDSDFVYTKSNHDNMDNFRESKIHAKDLPWMQGENRVKLNRFLFTHLLKPSTYLRRKVVSFLQEHVNPGERLICAHLRMGKNPTMPKDFRKSVDFKHLSKVWSVFEDQMARSKNGSKIFVMSDSEQVIEEVKNQTFHEKVFTVPGPIIHIEESRRVSGKLRCQGLEKVIFEEMILMQCDSMIISESGISRMAAYVRGSDENLFCFTPSGDMMPCKTEDIKNKIYNTRS